jgi:hypothetical protein
MHDERAAPYVELVPEHERFKSFHVIEPRGAVHSKGAASIATLALASRTSYVGRALSALRLTWLMNGLYWALSNSRRWLGRFVTDAPGPIRWG